MEKPRSTYRGSEETYRRVAAQIAERWGQDEVANYCPYTTVMSFSQWRKANYRIKRGEKSLKSVTLIERTNDEGKVIARYPRTVNLFYIKQVEPISN